MRNCLQSILNFNRDRRTNTLPIKYAAMAENPFRFFRGTCHLFYEDYAHLAQVPDTTQVWICGDLHLENLGTYRGDNQMVYFDLNDFDEAVLAPASWEITRLLTSIHLAIRTMNLPAGEGDQLAARSLRQYIQILQEGKARVTESGTARGLLKFFIRQVEKRSWKKLISSHTEILGHKRRIICDGTHAFPISIQRKKEVRSLIENWSAKQKDGDKTYHILDAAQRIAGTGSLGLERYVLLVEHMGNPEKINLLDLKEARSSSLSPWLPIHQHQWTNQAERIITVQKRVQHVSPALLSQIPFQGKSFVLKELQPMADKMDLNLCHGKLKKLEQILDTMAMLAASGQIRSGGQQGSSITDELKAFGHRKPWQTEVLKYAKSYSRQVLADYAIYRSAYQKGEFNKPGKKTGNN